MTQKQLEIFNEPIDFNKLDEEKQTYWIESCVDYVAEDSVLMCILDELIDESKERQLDKASDQHFYFDRLTRNGYYEVQDKIRSYASRDQKEGTYDKHSPT